MKSKFHNNDLKVRTLKIKDRTIINRYLPLRIPSSLAMERELNK